MTVEDVAEYFGISRDELAEALCAASSNVKALLASAEAEQDPNAEYVLRNDSTWPVIKARMDEGALVPWRQDQFGRQWYGPPSQVIHGTAEGAEVFDDEDVDVDDLAEIEALETETAERVAAAKERLWAYQVGGNDDLVD